MKQSQKTLALWASLILVGVMLYHFFDNRASTLITDFNFSRFIKAVQIGGPSGGCLPEELLDLPVDYDSLLQVGATQSVVCGRIAGIEGGGLFETAHRLRRAPTFQLNKSQTGIGVRVILVGANRIQK